MFSMFGETETLQKGVPQYSQTRKYGTAASHFLAWEGGLCGKGLWMRYAELQNLKFSTILI